MCKVHNKFTMGQVASEEKSLVYAGEEDGIPYILEGICWGQMILLTGLVLLSLLLVEGPGDS